MLAIPVSGLPSDTIGDPELRTGTQEGTFKAGELFKRNLSGQCWTSIIELWSLPTMVTMSIQYAQPVIQRSADITSQIETALSWLGQNHIAIPKPSEVRDYLLGCTDLVNILPFVCIRVREKFGVDAHLSLEVYSDPEYNDRYLALYIRQRHYSDQILYIIEGIRKEYESLLQNKSGWFLVTTDFQLP